MASASPQRKEAGLSLAFKRRTFGLCFRCLASDHFVAVCRGSVRCLGCGHSGHRERDCKARHAPGQAPRLRPRAPPAPPGRPSGMPACQAPLPCSGSPPAHRPPRSWAAVVAQQGDSTADPGVSATDPSVPAAVSGPLQPILAAQAEALSAELQVLFAARLQEVFQPLRELVAAVHGWADQVSRIWDLMKALGGSLVLANSSVPGEHEDSWPFGVVDGEETDADVVVGCSSEMDEWAQTSDVPPDLDGVLPQMVIQGVEKQAKVADSVPLGNGMELTEKPASPPGGNGVPPGPVSSTLLDEYLSSFCCTEPLSLLDAPIRVQLEGDSTCAGRRSGRLEKKNKVCSIPAAKRAEHRLAESFGDLPKEATSKKGSEEEVQEKMKTYLRMCKRPITPATTQAVRELVEVNA